VTSRTAVVGAAVAWGAAAIVLGLPSTAGAARFAIGLEPGASGAAVAQRLRERGLRGVVDLEPIPALAVSAPSAAAVRGVPGALYVEKLRPRRVAYVPNDPFLPRQWYAAQNRAFDAWLEPPALASVRVAVIDSGVDGGHPELATRIAASKSFVPGPATVDTQGHGTFVAGLIAAETNDGIGLAGLAPPAELLIAKVVGAQRSIGVEAEA
jgi:thermitase